MWDAITRRERTGRVGVEIRYCKDLNKCVQFPKLSNMIHAAEPVVIGFFTLISQCRPMWPCDAE